MAPGDAGAASTEKFPVVDTNMQTNIASETPAPSAARADTVTGDDDVHSLPTVADQSAPSAALLKETATTTPAPADAAAFAADKAAAPDAAEVTATETVGRPPEMAENAGDSSPFDHGSVDQAADEVFTTSDVIENAAEAASSAPLPRAKSPEVLTRTIAEDVVQQEAAAPSPESLPPLPSPRTPKPVPVAPVPAAGAPPLPRSANTPPRPKGASSAPPIPGSAAKAATNQSGVMSSAAIEEAGVVSSAAPPPPSPTAAAGSRSGVVSSAPPIPGMAPQAAAGGRPSDVLPRPPASAVVRPATPGPRHSAYPSPGQAPMASPAPIAGAPLASPAPIAGAPLASPAPEMGGAPAGQMMQSFPTPSNMARPPAPGMMHGVPPAQGMVDPSMVAMPAAYALPGTGYQPVAAPQTQQAPLVHTPIPPGLIGPPPDLNEGAGLGAALDSLDHENRRENTPAANAVWRSAHPSAQKWAAKRHGGSVRTPKPGIIALGLMLTGLGAYLLAIFLPSKRPLTAAKIEELSKQAGVDEHAWRFSEQLIDVANINAALFVLLGVIIVLQGALYKQQPASHARRGMSKQAIAMIFCFVLLAASFGALVMSAST